MCVRRAAKSTHVSRRSKRESRMIAKSYIKVGWACWQTIPWKTGFGFRLGGVLLGLKVEEERGTDA
jgi:hypothetical protein